MNAVTSRPLNTILRLAWVAMVSSLGFFSATVLAQPLNSTIQTPASIPQSSTTEASNTAPVLQDLHALSQAIEAFVQVQTPVQKAERMTIKVGYLDPRLHLASCDEPVEYDLPMPYQQGVRRTVRVKCTGTQPWQIYVPVMVHIMTPILVASRNMTRGERITDSDVQTQMRDKARLRQGFYNHLRQVVGKAARYPISQNQPITPHNTQAPTIVKRGQGVIILAQTAMLRVEMKGVALHDGGLGDTIPVRNRDSKRIIDAKILDAGRVQVFVG